MKTELNIIPDNDLQKSIASDLQQEDTNLEELLDERNGTDDTKSSEHILDE